MSWAASHCSIQISCIFLTFTGGTLASIMIPHNRFAAQSQLHSVSQASEHGAHAISSAETFWFVDLLGFLHLTVNLFSDEFLGDFGEIGGECAAKFLELGPEQPIETTTWRFDDYCLHVHPAISKGLDPVPTTERDKELSGPNVWDRSSDFFRRLAAGGISKECANAVGCGTSCGLLASRAGASKERFDFPELRAQPRLSGILSGHGDWAPS